jgi:ubiquinone/menaquinone biosynthesis C-methylase UbiE
MRQTDEKKLMSNIGFCLMSFTFKVRDLFAPRIKILNEVGIKPGYKILDYGCGSGSYINILADMVGKSGKIYALDINPLAVHTVQRIIAKNQLANVETILSGCETGLPDESMDVALLYDVLHDLNDPDKIFGELHRVLKSDGILSVGDHHLDDEDIVSKVTNRGFFRQLKKGIRTYSFIKTKIK